MLGQTNKLNLASVGLHHFDSNCTLLFALLCLHSGACTLLILCLHSSFKAVQHCLPQLCISHSRSRELLIFVTSGLYPAVQLQLSSHKNCRATWIGHDCGAKLPAMFFSSTSFEMLSLFLFRPSNVGCCRFGGNAAHCEIAGGFCENPTNTTNSQTKQKYHHWPWWGRMKRYF